MLRRLSFRAGALAVGGGAAIGWGLSELVSPARPRSAAAPLSASSGASPAAAARAVCVLQSDNGSGVGGVVRFEAAEGGGTRIEAEVRGLEDGPHGFHIHATGDLTEGCTSAGGHFNPFGRDHGGPADKERHVGDLGSIHSRGGVARLDVTDRLVQLSGPLSVVGRSIVVHAGEDDLGRGGHADSKTTGHAGGRVACGVIGIAPSASK